MASPSPTLTSTLTPKQISQLDRVAALMLTIFRTLARLRHLDPADIQPGPHDLTALLPLYRSLDIDPAIIYLYSVLPYLAPAARHRYDCGFFSGGRFVDYRVPEDVRAARFPDGDDDEDAMRPWMTPLSLVGNHVGLVVYDARRDVAGVFDNESGGNYDRNLYEGVVFEGTREDGTRYAFVKHETEGDVEVELAVLEAYNAKQERLGREEEEGDAEEEGEDEEEGDEDEDEEEEDEEDDDEEEEEDQNRWVQDEDMRPAPNFLRDVNRWYLEMIEIPGGDGGWNGVAWHGDVDRTRAMLRKYGWPGEDFDGDAFLAELKEPARE